MPRWPTPSISLSSSADHRHCQRDEPPDLRFGLGAARIPDGNKWSAVSWWAWIGGVMGATFVMSQLLVAQQIGDAPYLGLTVTAAVVTS